MGITVTSASWLREVSDDAITRVVGPTSFARGRQYADSGAVLTLVEGARGEVLLATVRDSGHQRYQTIVNRCDDSGRRARFAGRCNCAMAANCKHVAAVVLAARAALGGEGSSAVWEDVLRPLVSTPSTSSTPGAPAVALEVSLVAGAPVARGAAAQRIGLRPLREGKSKRWVRTGAAWTDLAMPWARASVRSDHQSVIAKIFALHQASSFAGYYGYGAPQVHLDDLGAGVWPLLRRAVLLGMPLVAGPDVEAVRLLDAPARLALDITGDSEGALTVRPRTSVDGEVLEGRLLMLGQPAHGLGVLDAQGCLRLSALAEPASEALSALVAAGTPVLVPASDAQRFLDLYYPVLARQVALGSSDESVHLPEAPAPRLSLDVAYEQDHRTRLSWGFVYGLRSGGAGTGGTRVVLEPARSDPPRDLEAEQRLLDSLTELEAVPRLQRRAASGAMHPHPAGTLTGLDTVTFTDEVLPALESREDIVVRVQGERTAYVQVDEAPVVHLQTLDTRPGGDAAPQDDWFDLQVSVTIAGEQVPFAPLFTALSRGEEVMLLDSGTWFTLQRPELESLRALIEEARELTDADGDTLQVTRYQVSLWEELVALGVVQQQSERWSQAVGGLLGLADHPVPPVPEALTAHLRPYQEQGYAWLAALWDARLGGVLADDMGLGKTVQALAMAVRAHERGELDAPLLVVAPASVVGTWLDEAARFAPGLSVRAITATQARRGEPLAEAVAGAHLVITSYTLLRLEAQDYHALPWAGLVLDEAQFVKNHRSKTYQAARRLGAPFTLAITGTPLENSLMDLWSMLSLTAAGLFPRPEIFAERYRKPIESGGSAEQLARLRRRVRPFLLRRSKAEVAPELPPKQEQTLHIELTPAHRRIYQQHLQRERQRVMGLLEDMDRNRVAIFRALTALRQLALDPSLVHDRYAGQAHSAKVESLVEQVSELAAEGHRALVFSSFTGFLALVRARLTEAGIGYTYLDGRTRNRPARIASFREGADPVFLISLKAGGFGLTLTEADYVFVLDPWWNPAAESQAIDRTHRIGQTRSVNVYRMVSADTIEEKVVALQERKRDLFAKVVDDGEFGSGAITADDIRALLDE